MLPRKKNEKGKRAGKGKESESAQGGGAGGFMDKYWKEPKTQTIANAQQRTLLSHA